MHNAMRKNKLFWPLFIFLAGFLDTVFWNFNGNKTVLKIYIVSKLYKRGKLVWTLVNIAEGKMDLLSIL